jgi:hypothetical protein
VCFVDGYFVFNETNSGRYWWTALYDGDSIDGLDFATAEGEADNIVTLIAYRKQVVLLGDNSLEIVYNSGGDPPFTSFQGGFNHVGCAAPATPARLGQRVAFLAKNDQGGAVPVSIVDATPESLVKNHPQVAYQMSRYTTIADATAYSYVHEGHFFYVLTFPTENVTWVYDALTDSWHQRAHVIDATFPNRERFSCHTFAFNKHLVGDYENGKIYELNSSVYSLDGALIPNQRTTTWNKDPDESRIRLSSIQLVGEQGVGGDVALSYSKDGGHTWSQSRDVSFGEIGKYKHRAIWRNLGQAREWVFRFVRSTNAKTVYTDIIAKEYGG